MERTNNANYYLFHKMVRQSISKYFVPKDKIQALVNAGVLTLKSEQKKVTTNMVTQFRDLPENNGPKWSGPIPES